MSSDLSAVLGRAIKMAAIAHAYQKDKAGRPYMEHLIHVMSGMDTDEERIVAILHDLVEDHPENTFSSLRHQGIPDRCVEAIEAITKRRGERYDDYLARVKANPLARRVKIEDLRHNADLRRIPGLLTQCDRQRTEKYVHALEFLYCDGAIVGSEAA
jgi:hypothetical protein